MIYLNGAVSKRTIAGLVAAGVGLTVNPNNRNHRLIEAFAYWTAENGCVRLGPDGRPTVWAGWDEDVWLRWLDRLPRAGCLFAVAPDVYPDPAATLERSAPYFELIRELGFPVALVAQDGAEHLELPWDDFDVLFIGGEARRRREWKVGAGAEALARRARNRGKWVHMGRVNSRQRAERARSMGCNSVDGNCAAWFARKKQAGHVRDVGELGAWLTWLEANQPFPELIRFETPALEIHKEHAS